MKTFSAVFENGVFRPTESVDLPEGTIVRVETDSSAPSIREIAPPGTPEGQLRIYENLSRRFNSGRHDTAERHNEHQP